jgi:hypothetical protein
VAEYLKHLARFFYFGDAARDLNPLRGLGVLGDGLDLRRVGEAGPSLIIDEVIVFDAE